MDWNAIIALSVAVLAIGFLIAIGKYLQFRRRDDAKLAIDLFRDFRSEEFKSVIRSIYAVRPDGWGTLAEYQKIRIDHLVDWFNLLGAVTRNREINRELAIETLGGPTAIRCWFRLEPYLKAETVRRGFFCENFEDFTRRALDYFTKAGTKIYFNFSEERVELVEYFSRLDVRPRYFTETRTK